MPFFQSKKLTLHTSLQFRIYPNWIFGYVIHFLVPRRVHDKCSDTFLQGYHEYTLSTGKLGEYMDVYVQAISGAGGSPNAHEGVENHCPPHHVPVSARKF